MPFQPGQSGNPAGKPPGTKNFTTKVRAALEKIAEGKEYTYEEALIKSILKKAIVDGDATSQRLIWNYLDGMPPQKLQHEGNLILEFHSSFKKDADTPQEAGGDNNVKGSV